MFYVGLCPVCREGLRGVRICCDVPNIVCDECDAVWSSPSLDDRKLATSDPACDRCQVSLWKEQAHWASKSEVERIGWWEHVEGEAGERSTSGGPRVPNEINRLIAESRPEESQSTDNPSSGRGSGYRSLVIILGLLAAGCAVTVLVLI